MIRGICPNLGDPTVKAEFEELVEILGEKLAYDVWDLNGGYSLDKAPNGEPSKLFQDLLLHYNGNRVNALLSKAKVYGSNFKNWFGDWIGDAKNSSKIVDENGEPLIVYHYSDAEITKFSTEYDNYFSQVKGGTREAIFFTGNPNPKKGTVLDRKYKIPVFLNARNIIEKTGTKDDIRADGEDFVHTVDRSSREADAAVFHGFDDNQELNQDIYVIHKPTNIKSIDNSGNFDINSANIFDRESSPLLVNSDDNIDAAMRRFRQLRYDFDATLDSLRQLITNAVQARIKSILNRKIPNKTALLVPLELLLSALKNPNIDSLLTIVYCLSDIRRTMTAPVNAVLRAQKNLREGRDSGFSNLALIQLQLDYFGMYNNVLEEIARNIFDSDIYKDILGAKSFDEMKVMISNMRTLFAAAKQGITEITTDLALKTLLKYGSKDKISRTELEQYISEDLITTENDVSTVMRLIGLGDKMNDKAARVIFDIVANANNKVRFNTHKFGNKLLRLQEEISLGDQMRLFEYDADGKKTGYLVRDRKYGEFMNNLEAERKRLKTKYNVPEGLKLPLDKEARTNFNREMNEWLSDNCERRYTKKYYDAFNSLSLEARDARDAIQFKIYKLLDDVRDNKGKVHLESLSDKLWAQYENYNILKKLLMSMYYEDGTPKTDLDKQIAEELTELNKTLHEGMRYVVNEQRFLEAKQQAKDTLTEEEYKAWKKRYTRVLISDEFWQMLSQLEKKQYGERYVELKKIREELTKPYRNDYTGGIDVKYMSSTLMSTLRSLDREMRKERKLARKSKSKAKEEELSAEGLKFEDIAEVVTTEQYERDKSEAVKRGIEYYELWERQHHMIYYIGEQEMKIPNWYYTRVIPKDQTLINYEAPTREFSEIDPNSEYYNNKFDTNIDEYYLPKESKYKNKEYELLFKPEKDENGVEYATRNLKLWKLYRAIIDGMEESNDKLTFFTRNNPYVLPLMSGSMYQYAKADGVLKGFFKYAQQGIVKEADDVGFVDAPTSRPDGSEQRMIPTYYINKLDDPNKITNDLVGAVIAYYKMAENFKLKTDILPDLEVIKMQLANRIYTGKPVGVDAAGRKIYKQSERKSGKDTLTYLFVSRFIDMLEYGEETKAIIQKCKEDSRIAKLFGFNGKELNWSKVILAIKNLGQLIGLGLNLAVGTVGFITSFYALLGFVANGRYFDKLSFVKSYYNMISNLFGILHYMHSTTTDNKYVALMLRFEIGTEYLTSYRNSNRVGIINTIANNWAFGLFSMSDFVIKGTILNSIMNNYRYYNGRFYNRQLFNQLFDNKEDANNIWKTLYSTYDIIEIKDGNIVIRDKQQAKAFAEVLNEISNAARSLSATADGLLTPELKIQFTSNAFGSLITMFRNYIPNLINERITMKKLYDYNLGMLREALYRTVWRVIPLLLKDWNARKQLDSSDIGNLKQFGFEMTMITLMMFLVKPLIIQAADDDKKNWALNFLALLVTKSGAEYANLYNPLDLLNTVTSVSSIIDIMNPFSNLFSISEIAKLTTDNKKIKYGPYKGSTKLLRQLWKMTPFKNIKEIQDPALKRKYYELLYK